MRTKRLAGFGTVKHADFAGRREHDIRIGKLRDETLKTCGLCQSVALYRVFNPETGYGIGACREHVAELQRRAKR